MNIGYEHEKELFGAKVNFGALDWALGPDPENAGPQLFNMSFVQFSLLANEVIISKHILKHSLTQLVCKGDFV